MSTNKIKHISFLNNQGERQIIKALRNKFKLEYVDISNGRVEKKKFWFKAKEFVEHPKIKDKDPVINFENGEKLRVYQSGDPTYMITEAASRLEKHDNQIKSRQKQKQKKKQYTMDDLSLDGSWLLGYNDYDD